MKSRIINIGSAKLLAIIFAVFLIGYGNVYLAGKTETSDKFEKVRACIQALLLKAETEKPIISSSYVKEKIVDDWDNQKEKYQILCVRRPEHYNQAGHIPHSINMYWRDIVKDENLNRLDPAKEIIIYCYFGNASSISYAILSLLGFNCNGLNFGMEDWNLNALAREPWDMQSDYEVETRANIPEDVYSPPVISSEKDNIKDVIKEMAAKYLEGESPVIEPAEVKEIVGDWESKKAEYQIVSVRSDKDYERGHIPYAINIPWLKIAEVENLKKLDPGKTIIVYSDNGQTGQIASALLNLLGYKSVNMMFGMADWNKSYVDESLQWDGAADYPVEYGN